MTNVLHSILERLQQLNTDGRGFILLAVSMGWFLSIGVRNIFPVLIPYLRESFSMSLTVSGLLFTSLWLAYALGQFPGGIIVDWIGERYILVISTVTSLLTLLILILADNVWMLFASTILFGLATALYGPARFTVLYDIYDDNDGLAIGITLAAGNVGNAVLPVIAGILAASLMWQAGFGFVIPLFVVSVIILWLKIPGGSRRGTGNEQSDLHIVALLTTVVRSLLQRRILMIAFILLFNTFVLQGFTGFYPTYLIEVKGISPSLATGLFGLFFLMGIVIQPLSGAGNDNFSPSLTIAFFLGCIAIGLLSLPFVNSGPLLVIVTLLLSSLMGIAPTATSQLVYLLPGKTKGSGLGLIRTIYMLLASTGSVFVGYFADIGYFDESFLVLSTLSIVACSLAITNYVLYED